MRSPVSAASVKLDPFPSALYAADMTTSRDTGFMEAALRLARSAAQAGETPIGAIIVDPATDEIIAEAHNSPIAGHDPTGHAEILVLRAAAARLGNYRLTGLELFVTLEPCAMCAGAISHARIGRLVYGAGDAKGGAVAHGPRFFEQPTCHSRPQVMSGILADESAALLRGFFRARRKQKPGKPDASLL
jgi:tRNA(adenine34) deaminase